MLVIRDLLRWIQINAFDYQFSLEIDFSWVHFSLFIHCFKGSVIQTHDPFPLATLIFAVANHAVL